MKEEFAGAVFKQCVATFKWIMWGKTLEAAKCRVDIFNGDVRQMEKRPIRIQFEKVDNRFRSRFRFTMVDESIVIVSLNEMKLTKHMYTNLEVYNRLGKCFCLAYDVALAKGGSEAVVESLYSVMKNQSQPGGQLNEVLVGRTKIDWHCPDSVLGIMDVVDEAARIHQKKHKAPIAKLNFGPSVIMQRLKEGRGKIPLE